MLINRKIPDEDFGRCIAHSEKEFNPQVIHLRENGTKDYEIDTISGYSKYWYENGQLQMEGKVSLSGLKNYRDSVWHYYSDSGYVMSIELYNKDGKVRTDEYLYFSNGKPLSETIQYFEGDPKTDKAHVKFHKIERIFYYAGGILSERHLINGTIVKMKCWDRRGLRRPIKYLDKVERV